MPEAFDYPLQSEYWVPLETTINLYFATDRAVYVLMTIGRPRDGGRSSTRRPKLPPWRNEFGTIIRRRSGRRFGCRRCKTCSGAI